MPSFKKFITLFSVLSLTATFLQINPLIWARASDHGSVNQRVQDYLRNQPGDYSVSAVELGGAARQVQVDETARVDPASIFKLFYALLAYEKIQAGTWTFSTRLKSSYTARTCLRLMISFSDNSCAVDFREKLGSRFINQRLVSLGFTNSKVVLDSRGSYQTKRTTSADVAELLSRLEREQLLNSNLTNEFRSLLKGQVWRSRISSGIEVGTPVASKSGQLLTGSGMIEADSAIVYGPNSTYVLVVFGRGNATGAVVRGVSHIIYRNWQKPIFRSTNYPGAQLVTKERVSLRSRPGGYTLRALPAGSSLTLVWSERGWLYVKFGTTKGFVYQNTIRLSNRYLNWGAL